MPVSKDALAVMADLNALHAVHIVPFNCKLVQSASLADRSHTASAVVKSTCTWLHTISSMLSAHYYNSSGFQFAVETRTYRPRSKSSLLDSSFNKLVLHCAPVESVPMMRAYTLASVPAPLTSLVCTVIMYLNVSIV